MADHDLEPFQKDKHGFEAEELIQKWNPKLQMFLQKLGNGDIQLDQLKRADIQYLLDFDNNVFWEAYAAHFKISKDTEIIIQKIKHIFKKLERIVDMNEKLEGVREQLRKHQSYIASKDKKTVQSIMDAAYSNDVLAMSLDDSISDVRTKVQGILNQYDTVLEYVGDNAPVDFNNLVQKVLDQRVPDTYINTIARELSERISENRNDIGVEELTALIEYNKNAEKKAANSLKRALTENNHTIDELLQNIIKENTAVTDTHNRMLTGTNLLQHLKVKANGIVTKIRANYDTAQVDAQNIILKDISGDDQIPVLQKNIDLQIELIKKLEAGLKQIKADHEDLKNIASLNDQLNQLNLELKGIQSKAELARISIMSSLEHLAQYPNLINRAQTLKDLDHLFNQIQKLYISDVASATKTLNTANGLLANIERISTKVGSAKESISLHINNAFRVHADNASRNQCDKTLSLERLLEQEKSLEQIKAHVASKRDELIKVSPELDDHIKKQAKNTIDNIDKQLKSCQEYMLDKAKSGDYSYIEGDSFKKFRTNYIDIMNMDDKYSKSIRNLLVNSEFKRTFRHDESPKNVNVINHYIYTKPNKNTTSFIKLLGDIMYVLKPSDRFSDIQQYSAYFGKIKLITYVDRLSLAYIDTEMTDKELKQWIKAAIKHIYLNQLLKQLGGVIKKPLRNVTRYSELPNRLFEAGIINEATANEYTNAIASLEAQKNIFSEGGNDIVEEIINHVEPHVPLPNATLENMSRKLLDTETKLATGKSSPKSNGRVGRVTGGGSIINILDVVYFILSMLFAAAVSIFVHEIVTKKCQQHKMVNTSLYAATFFMVFYTIIAILLWTVLHFPVGLLIHHLVVLYVLIICLTMLHSVWPDMTKKVSMAGLIMTSWCMATFIPVVYM